MSAHFVRSESGKFLLLSSNCSLFFSLFLLFPFFCPQTDAFRALLDEVEKNLTPESTYEAFEELAKSDERFEGFPLAERKTLFTEKVL
jgi:hypothetical protein